MQELMRALIIPEWLEEQKKGSELEIAPGQKVEVAPRITLHPKHGIS